MPPSPLPGHHRHLHRIAVALLINLVLGSAAAAPAVLTTDRYQTQRTSFEKALKAQAAGQHSLAGKLVLGLENYPLYPYYVYYDLRRRLHHYPSAEIRRFLTASADTYLGEQLRAQWLDQLGKAQRWSEYLEFYRPTSNVERRCLQLQARIRSGLSDGVLADTRAIWLSAKSLPDACDMPFARLYASELMGDPLVWARIRLAMQAGNSKLARYLARRLHATDYKNRFSLFDQAHHDPAAALARHDLSDDDETRQIMLHALARLARRQVERAEKAWTTIRTRLAFDAGQQGAAAAAIALGAARSDHPRRIALLDAVPSSAVDATLAAYQLREGIAARAWPELARWTAGTPADGVNALRWRYWGARALDALGRNDEARAVFHELARERDYYGFLAADAVGLEYQLNFKKVDAGAAEIDALLAVPGIPRARELYLLDRRFQARREWAFELARLEHRQVEVAAAVAAAWGWPDSAIAALGQAQSWDDLELRFPLLHVDIVEQYAARRDLAAARIMAIMRSESAFVSDARSPAGALGLMQLMPATARETARRIGLKLGSVRELHDPRTNIALGSAYLAAVLKRFDGNFAMAAAAYNAGPHRVRQWQTAQCIASDIWIDSIPFTETRRYVRRAYFYVALYEWRMGREMTRIKSVMPPVPAAQSNQLADCKT